jgi:hypothetical protein
LTHGLTLHFARKPLLKMGLSHYPVFVIHKYSRLKAYKILNYPQGTVLERMSFLVTCSSKEHAADVERRLHYLARGKIKQDHFASQSEGSKKSREAYALFQAAKDFVLNVSRLNPAEPHVQQMEAGLDFLLKRDYKWDQIGTWPILSSSDLTVRKKVRPPCTALTFRLVSWSVKHHIFHTIKHKSYSKANCFGMFGEQSILDHTIPKT